MKMRELDTYLRKIVDSLGEVIADQDFIVHRNICVELFPSYERTLEQRMIHADNTLLEYTLIQRNLVEKPYDKVHDFCVHEYKIDVKCIQSVWYSIPEHKEKKSLSWMKTGIETHNLTHFGFYKMNRPIRPLEVGDNLTFKYIKLEDADHVLNNLEASKFGGYRYLVKG